MDAERVGHEAGDLHGQTQKPPRDHKDTQDIEEEETRAAQGQATEDDQAFQDAEEGTHTSEQVEYINNWKRETAKQGGPAHMAHEPNKLFDEEGDGVEKMMQETAKPAGAGPAPTEVKGEAPTDARDTHRSWSLGSRGAQARQPLRLQQGGRGAPGLGAAAVQTESEQETSALRKSHEDMIETTMAKLAERMQDALRHTMQETQASFEALAVGKQETQKGKEDASEARGSRGERGDKARRLEEMEPQESPHKDYKLKANRYGDGLGDYTPDVARAEKEEEELETIIAEYIPPGDFIGRISATDPNFSNNLVGFEWVADKTAFKEWMSKLHWQAPTYTIVLGGGTQVGPEQDRGLHQPPPERRATAAAAETPPSAAMRRRGSCTTPSPWERDTQYVCVCAKVPGSGCFSQGDFDKVNSKSSSCVILRDGGVLASCEQWVRAHRRHCSPPQERSAQRKHRAHNPRAWSIPDLRCDGALLLAPKPRMRRLLT